MPAQKHKDTTKKTGKLFSVYSKLANDQIFSLIKPGGANIYHRQKSVTIRGGAGVIDAFHLWTPEGVVTEVTEDEMAILEQDTWFKRWKERGFIKVLEKKAPVEKVVKDMTTEKDPSSPVTPEEVHARAKKNNAPELMDHK